MRSVFIHESLFGHYYQKYFKKNLNPKLYGKDNLKDLIADFVKDTAAIDDSNGVLKCVLAADAGKEAFDFLKLAEECRRERQHRIDAGDDTVRINFDALKKANEQAEAAKKAQLDAAKDRALGHVKASQAPAKGGSGKGAAAGKAGAQDTGRATWNPSAGAKDQKATWNANAQDTGRATWNPNAGKTDQSKGKGYGAAKGGSKGYESRPYEVRGGAKAGGKSGKW